MQDLVQWMHMIRHVKIKAQTQALILPLNHHTTTSSYNPHAHQRVE